MFPIEQRASIGYEELCESIVCPYQRHTIRIYRHLDLSFSAPGSSPRPSRPGCCWHRRGFGQRDCQWCSLPKAFCWEAGRRRRPQRLHLLPFIARRGQSETLSVRQLKFKIFFCAELEWFLTYFLIHHYHLRQAFRRFSRPICVSCTKFLNLSNAALCDFLYLFV